LNWRVLVAVALSAALVLGFVPAFSQAGGSSPSAGVASVSFSHNYTINSYGFAVLNDSITFRNNGTSSVQIPTLQVGLPSQVASRTSGLVLSPSGQFSLSESQSNGNATITIAPDQPTLGAGSNFTVALKGVVANIMNFTSGIYVINSTASSLVLFSPSLNMNVTNMNSTIGVPAGWNFTQIKGLSGFTEAANNQSYTMAQTAVRPLVSAGYLNFTESDESTFTPIAVNSLVRTIVPAANGTPTVEDQFSIHNFATYSITSIHLNLLSPGLESVTVLADSEPPLIDPIVVSLSSGDLTLANANVQSPLLADSNITLTVSYPLPSTLMSVTGSNVKLQIPYKPIIGAPTGNYSIILEPTKGVAPSGPTAVLDTVVTPLTLGNVQFTYSVSFGWAADQAIPAGIFIFAVGFAMFAIQRPETEEEEKEGERGGRRVADVLNAFEEKMGLETQYMNELASASKGSISRTEFERMRNEVSELRGRAIQRLNQMKQALGSGKQFDLLTRVAEAEREEDRAFRDLLNLYLQYHGNRMNEETFKRLQPIHRKRVDAGINRLSDLLHETQTEEK
jgi:hypothetical protein